MTDFNSLLLYSLYAPTWTAYKKDKKATQQVKELNHVKDDVDAGSFNKMILPGCVELDKLKSYIGGTRNEFYLRTAPWGEQRGMRVGKAEDHMERMQWFGDRVAGLKPLLDAFAAVYLPSIQSLEFELNDMFNPEDYPPVEVVLSKFQLRLSVVPLPNVNDIRVLTEIPDHVKQEIEAQITADLQKSYDSTVAAAFQQLYTPLAHMAVTLKGYHDGKIKKLYDSVVENVRTMANAARMMNVSRNADLEKLADAAEALVADVTAKDLKESDGTQVIVGKKAQELANRIAKFLP